MGLAVKLGKIKTYLPIRCFRSRKFAPRCCVCMHPIMPEHGKEETVRVVALDRSFHVQCYRCEVMTFVNLYSIMCEIQNYFYYDLHLARVSHIITNNSSMEYQP